MRTTWSRPPTAGYWSRWPMNDCRWVSSSNSRRRDFPYFFEWLPLREGACAVGLEPSTHDIGGEAAARANGSMIWLDAGESRSYHTVFSIVEGAAPLAKAVEAIQARQLQPTSDVPA